jgi:hypothetical protein
VEWCRLNGLSSLTNTVHNTGKIWEELRVAVGLRPSRNFCQSSNGMRWLSQPEALLSSYLHARGIEHKHGERYPIGYEQQSGRKRGHYDLHFRAEDGTWIDVEVWGDSLNGMARGRYARTKTLKEAWHGNRTDFLGIPYKDCLAPKKLAQILGPFIGEVTAKRPIAVPDSDALQVGHFASEAELLKACHALAAQMPDGKFPAESWLRKRGKHAGRIGPAYNTLSVYVARWFGGTCAVRELLGQANASTTKWTPESVAEAWDAFIVKTGLTPSQCKSANRRASVSAKVRKEGWRIYAVASRLGILEAVRKGRFARQVVWTPEHTRSQWRAFVLKHGRTPSQCMSKIQRLTLPRAVTDEATNIYGAARRLGLLARLRRENLSPS